MQPIIGPALNQALKGIEDNQVYEILVNSDTHPNIKITKEDFDILIEFVKTK